MRSPVKEASTPLAVPLPASRPSQHESRPAADLSLDLVARQPNSENRPDDWNRFDQAFGYAQPTSPNDSAFEWTSLFL